MALAVSLVAVFSVGCGDDNGDFVISGNQNAPGTGNIVFQFMTAQAGTVPVGTATLAFDFYNNVNPAAGQILYTATSVFANTVTVLNVPVQARSVIITAYDAAGHPLSSLTSAVSINPGVNTNADLTSALITTITFDSITVTPDPAELVVGGQMGTTAQLTLIGNFSNGESITFTAEENAQNGFFTSNDVAVVNVSPAGLLTSVGVGATTVDVSYEVNGVTRSSSVDVTVASAVADVLTVTPAALTIPAGDASIALEASLSVDGGAATDVTGDPNLSYGLQAPVTGISVDASTGVVTVEASVVDGTTATVVATYNDGLHAASDTVAVTVGPIVP